LSNAAICGARSLQFERSLESNDSNTFLSELPIFQKILAFELTTRGKSWRLFLGKAMRQALPGFRLHARLASLFGRSVKVSVMGKTFNMDLRDEAVSATIFKDGIWEPEETEFLGKILRPGMVFIDIGAHIGYYTVIASSFVGGTGKVFAFEPDPGNFALLRKNVTENHCQNVVIGQKAIAASTQKVSLYRSKGNYGDHRTYDPHDEVIRQPRTKRQLVAVEALSLDDYFAARPTKIDVVKMDIQGSEYDAFIGMRRTLDQNADVTILTEFWPTGLKQAGVAPSLFLHEVRAGGFQIYRLEQARIQEISDSDILNRLSGDDYMSLILSRSKLPQLDDEELRNH
jgi:FkbM family methyltransferase